MRRLRRLLLTGLALLPGAPLGVEAQLEVLEEGAAGADGASSLSFQARTAPTFQETDLGPGRSITEAGRRVGTGAGRLITPRVTKRKLPTEASGYPEVFYDLTKDRQGRVWVHDMYAPVVYTESSSSWRRVTRDLGSYVHDLGRDAHGDIWAVGSGAVWQIRGDSLTVYDKFPKSQYMSAFTGALGDTVWVGGVSHTAVLLRFDGSQWRQYGGDDGLPRYGRVDALAVDSTGTVWAGLAEVPRQEWDDWDNLPADWPPPPLISYDGTEWRAYSFDTLKEPDFEFYSMRLLVDPGGTLWMDEAGRLMYKTDSGWVEYKSAWGLLMAAGAADQVWLFGYDQIGVFEKGGKWRYFLNDGSDLFSVIRGLYYDGEGVLWMGSQRMGRWRLPGRSTSVEEKMGAGQSYRSRLLDSYPNPFNGRATIGFEIDRSQPVALHIHNMMGQQVRTLAEGVYPPGVFAVTWDGRDEGGHAVASGVYLCRLRLAGQSVARPLTLVR